MNLVGDSGWKVSLFLSGLVVAGLIFWFGGGQGMTAAVEQSSVMLRNIAQVQQEHTQNEQTLSDTINTLRESVDLLDQRVTYDEKRRNFR